MNLPHYFLADLPPEAVLTPSMQVEACRSLRRNREQYLAGRSTSSLIRPLAELGENWCRPDYEFRQMALAMGPAETGFPAGVLARGLDAFFGQLTAENLRALVVQDLGHALRLDQVASTPAEGAMHRSALVSGPELVVHIAAGNVPSPAWMSVVTGLLVRSAQFLKCARGGSLLPRLFAHSLYQVEPKLASCLEVAEWKGGDIALEGAVLSEAEAVTATGSDEALEAIRSRVGAGVRFLGYGHRLSFGYVTREVLYGRNAGQVAARVADDVVAWNQLGCLSPHVVYVEEGGTVSPAGFAERVAEALAAAEVGSPRGPVSTEVAAGIAARRHLYEVRAAYSDATRIWASPESTAWTVVYEADPLFQVSCLHRFVYVKRVSHLTEALQAADAVRGRVSTVGLAAAEELAGALVRDLGRWGATRVCPVGQMQRPPLTWRHDGRPVLGDLVRWTDWEPGF